MNLILTKTLLMLAFLITANSFFSCKKDVPCPFESDLLKTEVHSKKLKQGYRHDIEGFLNLGFGLEKVKVKIGQGEFSLGDTSKLYKELDETFTSLVEYDSEEIKMHNKMLSTMCVQFKVAVHMEQQNKEKALNRLSEMVDQYFESLLKLANTDTREIVDSTIIETDTIALVIRDTVYPPEDKQPLPMVPPTLKPVDRQVQFSGVVKEEQSNDPVPNASVLYRGRQIAVTEADGGFSGSVVIEEEPGIEFITLTLEKEGY